MLLNSVVLSGSATSSVSMLGASKQRPLFAAIIDGFTRANAGLSRAVINLSFSFRMIHRLKGKIEKNTGYFDDSLYFIYSHLQKFWPLRNINISGALWVIK